MIRDPRLVRILRHHTFLANALAREDWDYDQLATLSPDRLSEPGWQRSWEQLYLIRGIGPTRMLDLVNALRHRRIELAWFVAFDRVSAAWSELHRRYRENPVKHPVNDLSTATMERLLVHDPAMLRQLIAGGYTDEQLARLRTWGAPWDPDELPGCDDLLEFYGVGPRRVARLIRAYRAAGIELGWFASFERSGVSDETA